MPPVSRVARNLVRSIIGSTEDALTTRQMYQQLATKFPKHVYVPERTQNVKAERGTSASQAIVDSVDRSIFDIQSMRHLKMDVLRELQERGEVQKVHTKRQISHAETSKPGKPKKPESSQTQGSSLTDAWVWRFTPTARSNPLPTEPTDAEPPAVVLEKSEPKTHLMMYPVPENNHLNTRRRNARPAKEKRDRAWATEIRKVMSEGAKEARASSNVA